MMTSEHSQLSLDNMMSSAEAFPVKTSAWQEDERGLQKNPDQVFFTNSCESYAWYDQSSSSWKTWQRSLITDWTLFSESFPKQGTMQNGQLYLRVHWEPAIEEVDGGSLPTPTASDVEGGIAKDVQYKNGKFFRENKKGVRWGVKLRDALHSLPTPTTMDHLPPRSIDSMIKQTQVHRKGRTKLANLREALNPQTVELFNNLQNLPTPTARDYKGRTSVKWNEKYGPKVLPDVLTQTGDHMSVSPYFVEEMMGYPIGWTELKP